MKPRICPKCSCVLNKNAVVCVNCGEKLEMPPKWYTKSGAIVAFLILFFPVGLFLMWKYSKWHIAVKIIITVILGFLVLNSMSNSGKETESINTDTQPVTSSATSSKNDSKPVEEVLEVDCDELYNAYEDNAISADAKYKGKTLQVTGQVSDIYREISGEPYVTIDVTNFAGIRLTFKSSEEPKIASLSKGQTITVKGRCSGKLVTDVSLDKCELIG